jgi:hypothetical protein
MARPPVSGAAPTTWSNEPIFSTRSYDFLNAVDDMSDNNQRESATVQTAVKLNRSPLLRRHIRTLKSNLPDISPVR